MGRRMRKRKASDMRKKGTDVGIITGLEVLDRLEIMDPTLRDSYVSDEVIRCIQIGLLCVQQNPKSRPTMARIIPMLSSSAITLPAPQQPAFIFGTKTRGSTSGVEMGWVQSTRGFQCSTNDVSITEFYPR
ncbi:hypothetical protein Gotur_007720 [Gossypium turneri]